MSNYLTKQLLKMVGSINAALSGKNNDIQFEVVKDAVIEDPKSLTKATVIAEGTPKEIICNFGVIKINGLNVPFIRYMSGKEVKTSVVLKHWPERYEAPEVNPQAGEVSAMALAFANAGLFGHELQESPAIKAAMRALFNITRLWKEKAGAVWGLGERQMAHDRVVVRTVKSCLGKCTELPSTPGAARHAGAVFEVVSEKQWNAVKRILAALLPLKAAQH